MRRIAMWQLVGADEGVTVGYVSKELCPDPEEAATLFRNEVWGSGLEDTHKLRAALEDEDGPMIALVVDHDLWRERAERAEAGIEDLKARLVKYEEESGS